MKQLLLLLFVFTTALTSISQTATKNAMPLPDSTAKAAVKAFRDSLEKDYVSRAAYPLIKSSKWSGVMPVSNVDEKPDINQHYRLLMEVTTPIKDSADAGEVNGALAEVGRLMNIHIAAGIPKKNLDVVVVAHGGILKSFYNNTVYKEKYKVENPNMALFNELSGAGVKFIACGQAMSFLNIKREEMLPWTKVALSAQTVLTDYQLKGYILKKVTIE